MSEPIIDRPQDLRVSAAAVRRKQWRNNHEQPIDQSAIAADRQCVPDISIYSDEKDQESDNDGDDDSGTSSDR